MIIQKLGKKLLVKKRIVGFIHQAKAGPIFRPAFSFLSTIHPQNVDNFLFHVKHSFNLSTNPHSYQHFLFHVKRIVLYENQSSVSRGTLLSLKKIISTNA